MLTFDNTEIAFAWLSNKDLSRAKLLFKTISWPTLVRLGEVFLKIALTIRFPISWVVKPSIFKHFVGGETLDDCSALVKTLANHNVKSILDYSVEGKDTPKSHEDAFNEILRSIRNATTTPNITFAVFKPTGLISIDILEKVSNEDTLANEEKSQFNLFSERVDTLCKTSTEASIPILVDAEDTWYQKALDDLVREMMIKYNKTQAIVYNTLQMYRVDRFAFLKQAHNHAIENGYKLGIKFVRGAYMEKERERAKKMGYPSPIHSTKEETDNAFNKAQQYAFNHIDTISIFCGTHNEESVSLLTKLMIKARLKPNDSRIVFSQLLGMSDNISFVLAHQGYNATKYIPYGPVKEVMPYLIRRAQENTSVKGQTSRELNLINQEIKRRKGQTK